MRMRVRYTYQSLVPERHLGRVLLVLQEVEEEAHEVVDDVRLVALAQRVEVDGGRRKHQTAPRVHRVNWNHPQNAHHVPLQVRRRLVRHVLRDVPQRDRQRHQHKHPAHDWTLMTNTHDTFFNFLLCSQKTSFT
jgi:hypothetical protein